MLKPKGKNGVGSGGSMIEDKPPGQFHRMNGRGLSYKKVHYIKGWNK